VINILHLRDTDRVCGPGKTIIETACAATRGAFTHKVGLLLLASETNNRYLEAAVDRGVEVVPLQSRHQFDPRIIGTIIRAVRDHDIDIIHSHDYKSDILAWLVSRVKSIPIMTTVHGWIRNTLKARVYIKSGQMVLSSFDRVVAVSEETRNAVLACGVRSDKVVVIHNAIVTRNYCPDDQAPGYLRQRFALPDDATLIGSIGRLSPEKGQRDLLSAAAEVVRARPDVWFVLVGDGPDRHELEQQAERAGIADRVKFTGHLTDVRPVFRDLDVMALTSHTEGFPNVVLESLCMQTPVVATEVGGVREIIEDGVTGLLIPPKLPDRIRDALLAMLERPDRGRALAMNGHRVVHDRFAFTRRVALEEELCCQMLASRNS
jgi:glycosyltransferase involved in cell wall biosynthesis